MLKFLRLLGLGLQRLLGIAETVRDIAEVASSARPPPLPEPPEEEPIPLSPRAFIHREAQIASATSHKVKPPPLKR